MNVVKHTRPRPVLPDMTDASLTGETEEGDCGDVQGLQMAGGALQGSGWWAGLV